jgi:thymidylate kinase
LNNFITIVGLDGSGKTTLINNFIKKNPTYEYFHFTPKKSNFSLSFSLENSKTITKKDFLPSSSFNKITMSYVRILKTFFTVHLLSYRLKNKNIISDRYIYGYFAQPIPLKYFGKEKFAKIIINYIKKPYIFIFLDTSPEICFSRKAELPLNELQSERIKWIELTKMMNGNILDGNISETDLVSKLENIILKANK